MVLLNEDAVSQIKNYKYTSTFSGFLDNHIVNPFCNSMVQFLPEWLAPNLITLLSLFHAIFSFGLTIVYSETMKEEIPRFVFFFRAFSLLMYQTLDTLDGKQARRMKVSSPLGQLFDHGCDALFAMMTGITLNHVFMIGNSPLLNYTCILIAMYGFFICNWEESFTGVMRFGSVGLMESQFGLLFIDLVCGVFGHSILKSSFYGLELRFLFLFIAGISCFWVVVDSIVMTYRNVDIQTFKQSLKKISYFTLYCGLCGVWILLTKRYVFKHYHMVMFLTILFGFGYIVLSMILNHISKQKQTFSYTILIGIVFSIGCSFFNYIHLGNKVVFIAFLFHLMAIEIYYVVFILQLIHELVRIIGIGCFEIPGKPIPKLPIAIKEFITCYITIFGWWFRQMFVRLPEFKM